ncbi:MAG TPA: patatin-like phospholipase family protein [Paludibacteraceae bacterium]|nr:patatin-like phospholipase family protein [Paludibacteraceae bacterium]HOU67563.1 patatin-like phospholipase family protein [Paludibacteraceae bacterium]HPH62184.1 patatin-like phospholipase family protein [Paludibacteraceae bacterium]HQF49589.1 patatin-like phospholipase family protein [Paludibacteraceae bacterium]
MRFIYALIAVFVFSFSLSAQTEEKPASRKKVAVVFSGGGAKGVAHVTALKVIEKAGIPIDIVVGTSMGALVGGFYSIGYTTDQLDSLVRNMEWKDLISDEVSRNKQSFDKKQRSERYVLSIPFKKPDKMLDGGLFRAQNVTNQISELTFGYHDSLDFNEFPRKFACVAINVVDGNEVVFHSGVLFKTLRASMAVPGLFNPVRMNGMVLVDGGMRNNFPVDVAREMGADYVIGIDLGDDLLKEEELTNFVSVLNQIVSIACKAKHEENVKKTDVYIKVNINGYTSASFNKEDIDSLCVRGETAAMQKWDELIALRNKIGVDTTVPLAQPKPYDIWGQNDTVRVKEVVFTGIDKLDEARLRHKTKLEGDSVEITLQQLKDVIAYLNGTMDYVSVNYNFAYTPEGYVLHFDLEEKRTNSFNLGLRYDTEENVAMLMNLTYQLPVSVPSSVSLTGRLGQRSSLRGDYSLKTRDVVGMNLAYMFQYNDVNVYQNGQRQFNVTYNYHMGELSLHDVFFQQMKIRLGGRYEYYDTKDFLTKSEDSDDQKKYLVNEKYDKKKDQFKTEGYVTYFAEGCFDSYNKRIYPSKGSKLNLMFSLHTDNMLTYKSETPIVDVLAFWQKVIPLSPRLVIVPGVGGRVLIHQEQTPFPYQNTIGGYMYGRYFQYQMPFVGLGNVEMVDDALSILQLDLRQRIMKNHYIIFSCDASFVNSELSNMMKKDPLVGSGFRYGYDSLFGPLELAMYYSSCTDEYGFYVNLGFNF